MRPVMLSVMVPLDGMYDGSGVGAGRIDWCTRQADR